MSAVRSDSLCSAKYIVYFVVIIFHIVYCDESDDRIVFTDKGPVRGHLARDGDYIAFQGIPYAEPPTREKRYKAPIPAREWNGILEANRTVICPQNGTGDEDCLIVNVFTPIAITNKLLPVIVFIHGGNFLLNLGPVDGVEHLVNKDLVVVTFNYRLGALGFLCLRTEDAPGNAGLKDQVEALKWVHRNIVNFGGNPKQVTIYGVSAGAISVELLLFSKYNSVLFHKAIVDSGSVTNPWAIDEYPVTTANQLFNLANSSYASRSLVDFYLKVPAEIISTTNIEYYQQLTNGDVGFAPCIEKVIPGVEPFLIYDPVEILQNHEYKSIPIMSAFETLEALWLKSNEYYPPLNFRDRILPEMKDFLPSDLLLDSYDKTKAVVEDVKTFYFGSDSHDLLFGYLHFYGDQIILHGHLSSAAQYVKNNDTIYLMEFKYKGALGGFSRDPEPQFYWIDAAGHADRSRHAFLEKTIFNQEDGLAVQRITTMIANFMKFGNPTPSPTNLLPVVWPAAKDRNLNYLLQDKELQVCQCPYWQRMQLWDNIYRTHGRQSSPVTSYSDTTIRCS